MISIREFDEAADLKAVEDMERSCDVGPSTSGNTSNNKKKNSGVSLYVDQLGDPLCRVRHSPEHIMLVDLPILLPSFILFLRPQTVLHVSQNSCSGF